MTRDTSLRRILPSLALPYPHERILNEVIGVSATDFACGGGTSRMFRELGFKVQEIRNRRPALHRAGAILLLGLYIHLAEQGISLECPS